MAEDNMLSKGESSPTDNIVWEESDNEVFSSEDEDKKEEEEAKEAVDVDLLTRYNTLLDRRPVLTKAVTAAFVQGFGAALGSLLASRQGGQTRKHRSSLRRSSPRINWLDVFAFALHGGLLNGPIGHYW